MPLLRKTDNPELWLLYTKTGFWMISSTAQKDANNGTGYSCSAEQGFAHPTLATEGLAERSIRNHDQAP